MKSLVEYVIEAKASKMGRKKFIDALASYAKEQGFTIANDDWMYNTYPKENTMKVFDSGISLYWDEGKSLTISNANQNGRLRNTFKVVVATYSNKGYKIANHAINFTDKADETFDISKMTSEESNDIIEKIKSLIDKKKIDKIFKDYYKKREGNTGYAYKYDDFDHSQIKYDAIK